MSVLDRIENFVFLELAGQPNWPAATIKSIERPGVDGTAFLNTGVHGAAFQVTSKVDVGSMVLGMELLLRYQTLIEMGPVAFVQGGADSTVFGRWVKVLDVQQASLHALGNFVGGINPPSAAMLVATWTLVGLRY